MTGVGPGVQLHGWRRVLRSNAERPTRFHSARGEAMPARAWLSLPGLLWRRARGASLDRPWLVPSCVSALEDRIRPDWAILELGAGASTEWLARRAARVISLEDDPEWHGDVVARLADAGLDNCDLRLLELDGFARELADLQAESFDLVLVDSGESAGWRRLDAVAAARELVRPGGLMVLDDSDRPEYRDAERLLPGWKCERFVGPKQVPLMAVESSVYRRPS